MPHEMTHLYCRQHGIQDTSPGGGSHNATFRAIAEEHGLTCHRDEKRGDDSCQGRPDYIKVNSNLTDQQIARLLSTLTTMQKANQVKSNKVVLPAELLELLKKCSLNRGSNWVCPKCGSVAISKNGKRNGRQRYFCKDCRKTFGNTYGTLLYHPRLSVDQWRKFLTLPLYNTSLKRIKKDIGINKAIAWYTKGHWRHSLHRFSCAILQHCLQFLFSAFYFFMILTIIILCLFINKKNFKKCKEPYIW